MGDPCEICGDVGFAKEIRICSECKVSREHVYCRKPMGEAPDVWLCEKCEFGTTASPKSEQKGTRESLVPEGPKWRKNFKAPKTKFLNPEDVIMLASGAKKFASSSRRVVPTTSGPYRWRGPNLTSTTPKPKPPTRIPLPNMGRNSDLRRPRPSSPAFVRGNISSANQQEVVRSSKDLKGKNVFQVPRNEPNSGKELQSHSRKDKMVRKEEPCSLPPLVDCTPIMSSRKNMACVDASADVDRRKSGAGNGELVNVLPEEKKVQGPAYSSSWTGNFRVPGTGTLKDLNVAIDAHTPDKVLWKLLEFSKKLPEVLSFELLPRPEVWTGIFQNYCPGKDDIGLYLFSGSSKRSENYVRLVEFMEASDLVLCTCVNGVELLVFSSKCLSTSSQKWGGEHFLWGLFRRVKKKKAEPKARERLPPPAQPSSLSHENGEIHTVETSSDMEVDMIGGIEVGTPDIRIPREPSWGTRGSQQEVMHTTQHPVLPGVRKQGVMDIPPGFEESYRKGASSQQW